MDLLKIPSAIDLYPFSNLSRDDFETLHQVVTLTSGELLVPIRCYSTQMDVGKFQASAWPLIHAGHVRLHPEKAWGEVNLTAKGRLEMTATVNKFRRHQIMVCMYHLGEADPTTGFLVEDIAGHLKINAPRVGADLEFLCGRGLVETKWKHMEDTSYYAFLTANGIAVVEGADDSISKAAQMIVHGDALITHGPQSPIQSRNRDSSQSATQSDEREK